MTGRWARWNPRAATRARSLAAVPAKCTMTPYAGGKPRGAGQRFARCDHLKSAAKFVVDGVFFRQVPLPLRRQPIAQKDTSREADGDPCQPARVLAPFPSRPKTIVDTHASYLC